jgi:hypothetical protein
MKGWTMSAEPGVGGVSDPWAATVSIKHEVRMLSTRVTSAGSFGLMPTHTVEWRKSEGGEGYVKICSSLDGAP